MPNVSKIILNGTTLIDATGATATANEIVAPYTAMTADGAITIGTASNSGGSNWQILYDQVTTEDGLLSIGISNISIKEFQVYIIQPTSYSSSAVIYVPLMRSDGSHYGVNGYCRMYVSLGNSTSSAKRIYHIQNEPLPFDGYTKWWSSGGNVGSQFTEGWILNETNNATANMDITSLSIATYVSIPAGLRIILLGR